MIIMAAIFVLDREMSADRDGSIPTGARADINLRTIAEPIPLEVLLDMPAENIGIEDLREARLSF